MSQKIGFRLSALFFVFAFVLTFSQITLFTGEAQAAETAPLYVGEILADAKGDVSVLSSDGERLNVTSSPMPIFEGSIIEALQGSAVVSLSPDGIVEMMKGSEIKVDRYGDRNFISINSGAIKFAVPSGEMLSVAIPSEGISITLASSLASTGDNLPASTGARAGFVELQEDGTAIVSSSKGSFEVSTVEGKSMVVAQGDSVKIARSGGTSKAKSAQAAAKTHDLYLLGATVGLAAGVAIISSNTDSGGGVVASP